MDRETDPPQLHWPAVCSSSTMASDDPPAARGKRARRRRQTMKRARTLHELTQRNVDPIGHMEQASETHRTFGERAADAFAAAVGSWTFLIVQTVLLGAWVALNLAAWTYHWDPYPFILLNLVLSFQAA